MQSSNKFFDDLAKVVTGAASTFTGVKSELETFIRQNLQRLLKDADLVKREEFEVIKSIAIKARTEQEKLEVRIKDLEKEINTAKKNDKTKTIKKTKTKKSRH
ncbi:MAG: pyrroline-5-carboxylate reductase [Magnetovibrio sp.]|nr:pyrroline-5-carboxylate reductase [Magnetovibrio sp.]|tara:strand:+ start:203 stop:511 length:309 start_codon:yes stop_codon:yes gene_type:complete